MTIHALGDLVTHSWENGRGVVAPARGRLTGGTSFREETHISHNDDDNSRHTTPRGRGQGLQPHEGHTASEVDL